MAVDLLVVASSLQELEGFQTNETGPYRYHDHAIAVLPIGVGKVQAAVSTMQALAALHPKRVLCTGYAGAVEPSLAIGDCVMATSVVQYDLDLQAFGLERGEVFDAEGKATGALETWCPSLDAVVPLRCGSADRFLVSSWRREHPWLSDVLHVGFCDMESYAVVLACRREGVPCMVCRIISDDAAGHRPKRFSRFRAEANARIVETVQAILDIPE